MSITREIDCLFRASVRRADLRTAQAMGSRARDVLLRRPLGIWSVQRICQMWICYVAVGIKVLRGGIDSSMTQTYPSEEEMISSRSITSPIASFHRSSNSCALIARFRLLPTFSFNSRSWISAGKCLPASSLSVPHSACAFRSLNVSTARSATALILLTFATVWLARRRQGQYSS